MMAESIISVSVVTFSSLAGPLGFKKPAMGIIDVEEETRRSLDGSEDHEVNIGGRSEEEADRNVVLGGVTLSCIACVVLVAVVFGEDGIKWWATMIALVLASIFSVLGSALLRASSWYCPLTSPVRRVRALGETDLNPVSAIGKISQLLFAIVQPHNIVANLIAGGISEAGAQQAGDLMQDLKTGHLHGASPKAQFQGQMIGSLASVFVSSGIYVLYRNLYDLPSTSFPVPTAAIW